MKNILLLGDSVRQNYQEYVSEQLKNVANVSYPKDNGRFCQYTLRYLHEWVDVLSGYGKISFDIIHFNCGLWDVLRLSNENKPLISESEYGSLLRRIVDRIQYLCPEAKVIFALTTKVIEPGFGPGVRIGERKNRDIIRYNDIAERLFAEMGIEVNDLWSISDSLPREAYSDMVHFETDIGVSALGEQVVKCLKKYCK